MQLGTAYCRFDKRNKNENGVSICRMCIVRLCVSTLSIWNFIDFYFNTLATVDYANDVPTFVVFLENNQFV